MASPGIISFQGLGEPLKQLRELIKDLWYRNSQEKRRGELELEMIERHIRESNVSPDIAISPASRALLLLHNGTSAIKQAEEEGRLRDVAGSLERP